MISSTRLIALVAVCAFICATFVAGADIEVNDPDVTVLTDDNFNEFINNDLTLVEFYAPWCGHCKSLAPEYATAATALLADGIKLGKLDATIHTRSAGLHDIKGYPTLKVFRNGKSQDYNGPRKSAGIIAFMRKQVGPSAKPLTTVAELDALVQKETDTNYVVLALFADAGQSQLQSSFEKIANNLRDDFVFARSTSAELKAAYGVAADGEALITFLKGEKSVYDGASKRSDVEAFIRENSLPLVGEYSEATSALYAGRKLPIAKLFVNVDKAPKSKTMTYYINRLKKIAAQFKGRVLVAYSDRVGQKGQLEHLNMQGEDHGFVVDDVAAGKQYKYDAPEEDAGGKKKTGLDVAGWIAHIESFLGGGAQSYVKSERAPKNNLSNPVKIATGQNFDSIVNADDKDVLIEFYAPWCGHCKSLSPKYDALGSKFLADNASGVTIAKIDATANEYDRSRWEVKGYPTIFFKPAGGKAKLYDGARETDAMYEYVKANGKTTKKSKKSKKAAAEAHDDEL